MMTHYNDVISAPGLLQLPVTLLFVQQFADKQQKYKSRHYCLVVSGIHLDIL